MYSIESVFHVFPLVPLPVKQLRAVFMLIDLFVCVFAFMLMFLYFSTGRLCPSVCECGCVSVCVCLHCREWYFVSVVVGIVLTSGRFQHVGGGGGGGVGAEGGGVLCGIERKRGG